MQTSEAEWHFAVGAETYLRVMWHCGSLQDEVDDLEEAHVADDLDEIKLNTASSPATRRIASNFCESFHTGAAIRTLMIG
jgi:hypothetical protein